MVVKQRTSINKLGFLLSVIGSTVGLGGIWAFPTQMYNHRGAFLIPFIICMVICAIPVLFIEMTISNKTQKNHIEFFSEVGGKKGAFFAWLHSSSVIILSTYYSVLIAWTLINIVISFTTSLNTSNFFYEQVLHLKNNHKDLQPVNFWQLGAINWKVLIAVLVVWIMLFTILSGGVEKGIDKANKVFIPSLFIMVAFLVIYTATFQGAATGLNYMFEFKAKELLNSEIWKNAFGQAFFMLSTCTGTIYIYAAHAPKRQDNTNHAFVVAIGTSIVGVLTTIIIFNAIGAIAFQKGDEFDQVFSSGPTLIFQVLPELFKYINSTLNGLGNFISIIFFLTLFFAGISSLIGQVESMINGLEYKLKIKRIKALLFTCIIAMSLSVLFTLDNSSVLFNVVAAWVAQNWLLIIGLVLLIAISKFGWNLYPDLQAYNNETSWFKWNKIYSLIILLIAPLIVLANVITGIYEFGIAVKTNIFLNGIFGLGLGVLAPILLTFFLTYYQEIKNFFAINKDKKEVKQHEHR